jgi:hypothetical protein
MGDFTVVIATVVEGTRRFALDYEVKHNKKFTHFTDTRLLKGKNTGKGETASKESRLLHYGVWHLS